MHICLLSGEYPPDPGGVGAYTDCLAAALRDKGQTVTVLTIRAGRLVFSQMLPDGAATTGILAEAGDQLDWSLRCWPALITALAMLRPAWLHIQYQTGAYAMRPGINLLPWRLRGLPGRPRLAVTFHDLLVPYLWPKAGPFRQWVNHRLASDVDALVATNPTDAARLCQLAPHGPSPQVIAIGSNIALAPPPGFARMPWRATLGVAPAELLVAYFGLLSTSKGVDQLLEALVRLRHPWRLLLIGGAATAPADQAHAALVHARIDALGLAPRVISTGHLSDALVSAHLLSADCVALPFRDGASFRRGSLLAALAHGCPLVTTTPAVLADATALAPAALLVPPDDPPALAAALERLAAEPELARQLAGAGQALAGQFSWSTIATRHIALYQQVQTGHS